MATLLYLKETISAQRGGKLCFDDCNIFVTGDLQFQSINYVVSKLIGDSVFNTDLQQDAGEALGRLLETVPQFSFCQYQSCYQYKCRGCSYVFNSDVVPANILRVAVPSTIIDKGLLSMSNIITMTCENMVAVDGKNVDKSGVVKDEKNLARPYKGVLNQIPRYEKITPDYPFSMYLKNSSAKYSFRNIIKTSNSKIKA